MILCHSSTISFAPFHPYPQIRQKSGLQGALCDQGKRLPYWKRRETPTHPLKEESNQIQEKVRRVRAGEKQNYTQAVGVAGVEDSHSGLGSLTQ